MKGDQEVLYCSSGGSKALNGPAQLKKCFGHLSRDSSLFSSWDLVLKSGEESRGADSILLPSPKAVAEPLAVPAMPWRQRSPRAGSAHLPITAHGQGAVPGSRPLQPGGEPATSLGLSEGCSPSKAVLCSLGAWHQICARKGSARRGVAFVPMRRRSHCKQR